MTYRPEIDGLRACAVVPILLFHLGLPWIPGGFVGVDVFFVISGYLITSIVLKELERGTFSFRGFWARRVRRIVPALTVVTAASLAFTWICLARGDRPSIGRQAVAALLSVANVHFWRTAGSYWGERAEESPFLHTWSLSVEEQFYLLFPLCIWLVHRHRPRWLPGLLVLAIGTSFGGFLYGIATHATATFYLLPTRAWELATGCLLAVLLRGREHAPPAAAPSALSHLGLMGVVMIVVSCFALARMNAGLAIPIAGTALVIAFARDGAAHAILAQRHVVWVGKASYSLYLWHWPVMVFSTRLGFQSHRWALLPLTFALGSASYAFVERPTRARKGMIPYIGASYVAVLCTGAVVLSSRVGYDTSEFRRPRWCGLYYDLNPRDEANKDALAVVAWVDAPLRDVPDTAYLEGGVLVGEGTADPEIVVLGDSHGVTWSETIRSAAERCGVRASLWSLNALSPFIQFPISRDQEVDYLTPEEKFRFDQARVDMLRKWTPAVVIVCRRWSVENAREPRALLEFLEELGSRVFLLEQPPELAIGNRLALEQLCHLDVRPRDGVRRYLPLGDARAWEHGRALVRQLAERYDNCAVIPTSDLYLRDSKALVLDGRDVVYLDNDHLTVFGTNLARERIEQEIVAALRSSAQVGR